MTLLQKNVLLHYDPASEIYLYSVHYDLTSENVPVYTMTPLPPGVFPWPREHQQPGEEGLSTIPRPGLLRLVPAGQARARYKKYRPAQAHPRQGFQPFCGQNQSGHHPALLG